jgi:hypothetical protein
MDPRRRPSLVLIGSALLGLLTGVFAVALAMDGSAQTPMAPASPASPAIEPYALRVLRSWDHRRAVAYARADAGALADLYVTGSRTGSADVALLRGYRSRGLRVAGMRTQVLVVRVVHRADHRLALLVTDVLAGGFASGVGDHRWALPHDRPSTHRVVLVRSGHVWRVAETYADD